MPTGTLESAFSLVSQVPGMNRLNVAAQLVGAELAIAGAVSRDALPVTAAAASSATGRQVLDRLTGIGTSITGRDTGV